MSVGDDYSGTDEASHRAGDLTARFWVAGFTPVLSPAIFKKGVSMKIIREGNKWLIQGDRIGLYASSEEEVKKAVEFLESIQEETERELQRIWGKEKQCSE